MSLVLLKGCCGCVEDRSPCATCGEGDCTFSLECWTLHVAAGKCGFTFIADEAGIQHYYREATITYSTSYDGAGDDVNWCMCPVHYQADIVFAMHSPDSLSHLGTECGLFSCTPDTGTGAWIEGIREPDTTCTPLEYNSSTFDCPGVWALPLQGVQWRDSEFDFTTPGGIDPSCSTFVWYQTVLTPSHAHWHYNDSSDECAGCGIEGTTFHIEAAGEMDTVLSDEITTELLLDACVPVQVESSEEYPEGHFTWHNYDGACSACKWLAPNEASVIYDSTVVRVTNTSAAAIIVSWVRVKAYSSEESPCSEGASVADYPREESVELAVDQTYDIEMILDPYGPNCVMYLRDFTCMTA